MTVKRVCSAGYWKSWFACAESEKMNPVHGAVVGATCTRRTLARGGNLLLRAR